MVYLVKIIFKLKYGPMCVVRSVTKKMPNVYKSRTKMISLEKWLILTPFQKFPKNMGDLGTFFGSKCFENLPKVQ